MKKLIVLSLVIIYLILNLSNCTFAQDNNVQAFDSTITVNKGDSISIVLESNKTTGYSWQLGSNSDSNIVKAGSVVYDAPSMDIPGQGGKEIWTFKTVSQGTVVIILHYLRPWEKDTPPARINRYTIVVIPAFSQYVIETKTYEEFNKKEKYEINLSYPHLKYPEGALMGVRGMINEVNLALDTFALKRVGDFKSQAGDLTTSGPMGKSTLESKYEMVMNTNTLVSIKYYVLEYIDGSAHPMDYVDCFNYSFNTGSKFTLKDMFIDSSGYLKYISDYCIRELKKAASSVGGGFDKDIENGASPDLRNFSVFNVNNNFLNIVFNYYQVGPRQFGIQTITLDMNNMKDMMNPEGPIGILLKQN